MNPVSICLVEKSPLIREGLKNILDKTNFRIIAEEDTLSGQAENAMLVILGINDHEKNTECLVKRAKSSYPASRIALLSSDPEPEFIKFCFSQGVDGYLSKNMPPPSLLGSLEMIMAGERIYPVSALDSLIQGKKDITRPTDHGLSHREVEILMHVADGKTNKEIALHRNIAESTVKSHIKTILRKLNLSNRTQAARWAFNAGISRESSA